MCPLEEDKRGYNSLELESQRVLSSHVGSGDQICGKATSALGHWTISPVSPKHLLLLPPLVRSCSQGPLRRAGDIFLGLSFLGHKWVNIYPFTTHRNIHQDWKAPEITQSNPVFVSDGKRKAQRKQYELPDASQAMEQSWNWGPGLLTFDLNHSFPQLPLLSKSCSQKGCVTDHSWSTCFLS